MKNPADHPIHDVLAARWSPSVFDPDRPVAPEALRSLFEAARWTMSSYNEQPWRYVVGVRGAGDGVWERVLGVLAEGNRAWAGRAPVLALGLAARELARNGRPNRCALHDLGAASASLTFEATSRGLSVHQMAGVDREAARAEFDLDASLEVVTGLAIGYVGDPATADEALARRDRKARERRPLDEIVVRGGFGGE